MAAKGRKRQQKVAVKKSDGAPRGIQAQGGKWPYRCTKACKHCVLSRSWVYRWVYLFEIGVPGGKGKCSVFSMQCSVQYSMAGAAGLLLCATGDRLIYYRYVGLPLLQTCVWRFLIYILFGECQMDLEHLFGGEVTLA